MHFNVDRIAVLAGLGAGGQSGVLREAVEVKPKAPAAAPAPAGSKTGPISKPGQAPKAPAPAPAGTKAPTGASNAPMEEDMYPDFYDDEMDMGGMGDMGGMEDEFGMYEEYTDEGVYEADGDESAHETMYEIDETELMEALVDMRQRRINESRVRGAVRTELNDILNEMESGSRWMYGNRKPSNSGRGSVSRGFLGPGFR